MKAEVRQRMLSLREQSSQLIDMTTADELIFAGWTDAGQARDAVKDFEEFVKRATTTSTSRSRPTTNGRTACAPATTTSSSSRRASASLPMI